MTAILRLHLARWTQLTTGKLRSISSLAGTASQSARHLVLHSNRPVEKWPARFEEEQCVLSKALELLNEQGQHAATSSKCLQSFAFAEQEQSAAYIYPDFVRLELADSPEEMAKQLAQYTPGQAASSVDPEVLHIYICTHGSRDCRCGIVGSLFFEALVKEINNRRLSSTIKVFPISHIGGHKFAANALVYPTADWYGALNAEDASTFLNVVLDTKGNASDLSGIWWAKWRGRLGLSEEEQLAMYESREAFTNLDMSKDSYASLLKAAKAKRLNKRKQKRHDELGDLLPIVLNNKGQRQEVSAFQGETLKDCLKRSAVVDATCGGFLECATCHAVLEPPFGQEEDMSDEELDQLELDSKRRTGSRLACAIPIDERFIEWSKKGGVVTVL